jgi:hypothetical protein
MKTFLAVYLGSPSSPGQAQWNKLDDAARQARMASGMKAWQEWMTRHKDAVVIEGGPLGKTKRVGPGGISDTKNELSGYVVVRAETPEAAARMFENHPHFAIFPGDAVEVVECLPIPGR